jgi:hypothetical protein
VVLRTVLWPRSTARRLPVVQANATAATRRLLAETWVRTANDAESAELRRRLQRDLISLRAVHTDALADTWPFTADSDQRWPLTVAVDALATLALSWPPDLPRPPADQRQDVLHYLDRLAETIGGGGPPPGVPPSLPDHPRTTAALAALSVAVTALKSAT